MASGLEYYRRCYEEASRGSEDGFALFVNGRLCAANDRIIAWTGYSRDTSMGKGPLDFTHPDDHEFLGNYVYSGSDVPVRIRGKLASGKTGLFEISARNITNDSEDFVRIVRFKLL